MNATKGAQNFKTSPIEPREAQGWLSGHKGTSRKLILEHLTSKGYRAQERNVSIFCNWKYKPFRFVWGVCWQSQRIKLDKSDGEDFVPQIPECHPQVNGRGHHNVIETLRNRISEESSASPSSPSYIAGASAVEPVGKKK